MAFVFELDNEREWEVEDLARSMALAKAVLKSEDLYGDDEDGNFEAASKVAQLALAVMMIADTLDRLIGEEYEDEDDFDFDDDDDFDGPISFA